MNAYDFDNTIYDGESTLDFYFYCVKHHPRLLRFVFIVLFNLVKYKLCLITEDELMELCKKYVIAFLKDCPDAEILAKNFWKKNKRKLKTFYKDLHRDDDVIISASFGFMLRPAMELLGVDRLVCSEVDLVTGDIERLCFRRNKAELFRKLYSEDIWDFYTDSMNDLPLMKLANGRVFLVKGNRITEYLL